VERHTILSLQKKKKAKDPIVALTCYDAFSGRLIDQCGVDIALVGDSLANTRLGYPNTLPVTMDEMVHHVKAASRGVKSAFLVADMPFQSYEVHPAHASMMAGRFIKEGGAQAVKVEGGGRIIGSVKAILKGNIPVMGHIGLNPQAYHVKGGYRVQGKSRTEAKALLRDAKILENNGVFAIVLEGIPASLSKKITKSLRIPTIGIGAGSYCDGQILVLDDLLGMTEGPSLKFVKAYANLRGLMSKAIRRYRAEVKSRRFPSSTYSY